jgi:hypothetical protein
MANYSVWNVRKRHEWLATPLKKKRIKRRQALRIGLWDAWERKGLVGDESVEESPEGEAEAENKD